MGRGILCSLWLIFACIVPAANAQIEARLPVMAASAGESVHLPITVSDIEGSAIFAYEFSLRYEPEMLELQGVEIAGTMSEGGMQITNTQTPGKLRFAFASGTKLSGEGPLLILTGKALREGAIPLHFEGFQFNEGTPEVLVVDGLLRIGHEGAESGATPH